VDFDEKSGAVKCVLTLSHKSKLINSANVNLTSQQGRERFIKDVPEDLKPAAQKFLMGVFLEINKEVQLLDLGVSAGCLIEFSETELEEAYRACQKGEHVKVIHDASETLYAGDPHRKRYVYLGCLSSSRSKRRVHIFAIGGSQKGKSYLLIQMAKLFLGKVEYVDSSSAKSFYYKAKKYGSEFFRGKIVIVDELLDNESLWSFMKAITSMDKDQAMHTTVIEGEFLEMFLDGLPVVLSSAVSVPIGPRGDQIANRFHVVNIDESEEQDNKVRDAIVEGRTLGDREARNAKIIREALAITHVLGELASTAEVVIPYARWIVVKDKEGRRNEFPKFLNVLEMCTIFHGFQRARLPTGEMIATFKDYEEAAQIWIANERYRSHVPEKVLKLLDLMDDNVTYAKEELCELTGSLKGKETGFRKQLSAGSIENYLSQLRTQDLVTSIWDRETRETKYKVLSKLNPLDGPNLLTDFNSAYLGHSSELQLPNVDELAKELKAIYESKLTTELHQGSVTTVLVPLDYSSIAQEILDTSTLFSVKKLRIEHFDDAGTVEKGEVKAELSQVKELRQGANIPMNRLADLTTYWQQIEALKALVRTSQKSGYGETWIFEKCDEAGIADPDSKLKWLLSRGEILKTDEGFRLARDG
jgi:hypothetical protein